jgi:AcrR family transcriptional regulator
MGTVDRREREREEMRDAIVSAAQELFLTEGFAETSIRRIAEKIEYTPGAIYSYFRDKDEILYEVHKRGFARLAEYLRPALALSDPLEKLHETGRLYMKFAFENPQYYDLMFISRAIPRSFGDHKDWEEGGSAYGVLAQCVTECMEQGKIPTGDVQVASFLLWSMVHGMISLVLRRRCVMCAEAEQKQLLEISYEYWFAMIRKQK